MNRPPDPPEVCPRYFFEALFEVRACLKEKEPLMFLDYDGTLTPIVATPDLAVLSDEMRGLLARLAARRKVAVVSGRATDDVRSKVRLEGLYYAGSHGFEIVAPDGRTTVQPEVEAVRPIIDAAYERLSAALKDVPGALVEHVKYTISAHYRLVSDGDLPRVRKAVDEALTAYPQLRRTDGKKVFELRPRIDWHKGRAVAWILEEMGCDPSRHLPIYVGDDTTDEDAFRVLRGLGFGVLVADPVRTSGAVYYVRDTTEVGRLLEFFITDFG